MTQNDDKNPTSQPEGSSGADKQLEEDRNMNPNDGINEVPEGNKDDKAYELAEKEADNAEQAKLEDEMKQRVEEVNKDDETYQIGEKEADNAEQAKLEDEMKQRVEEVNKDDETYQIGEKEADNAEQENLEKLISAVIEQADLEKLLSGVIKRGIGKKIDDMDESLIKNAEAAHKEREEMKEKFGKYESKIEGLEKLLDGKANTIIALLAGTFIAIVTSLIGK